MARAHIYIALGYKIIAGVAIKSGATHTSHQPLLIIIASFACFCGHRLRQTMGMTRALCFWGLLTFPYLYPFSLRIFSARRLAAISYVCVHTWCSQWQTSPSQRTFIGHFSRPWVMQDTAPTPSCCWPIGRTYFRQEERRSIRFIAGVLNDRARWTHMWMLFVCVLFYC